jgi:hypothetical protein
MKCPYCQNTIEISLATQAPAPLPYNPTVGKILALVRSGERIKALNIVREVTGNTSLLDASDIVDAIERGEQVDL